MVRAGDVEKGRNDTYTFLTVMGSGSYGQVWKAQKQSTGEYVAIKIYMSMTADDLDDFYQELENLEAISQYTDVCEKYSTCLLDEYSVNGLPRVVMSIIAGIEMAKYIHNIPVETRVRNPNVPRMLIRGMNAFHKLGIAHLDLKEENIIIDDMGNPHYIDWGLSCLEKYCTPNCDDHCSTSGTAYTMPPELIFGAYNQVNFQEAMAHDIWSLGVILLDWYTFPKGADLFDHYYNRGARPDGLSNNAILALSPKKLQQVLGNIPDPKARTIVHLMLQTSTVKRVEAWPRIIRLAADLKVPESAPVEIVNYSKNRVAVIGNIGDAIVYMRERGYKHSNALLIDGKLTSGWIVPKSDPNIEILFGTEIRQQKFTDPSQCHNSDVPAKMSNVMVFPTHIPGKYWCISVDDVLKTLDPSTGEFINEHTGFPIKLNPQTMKKLGYNI